MQKLDTVIVDTNRVSCEGNGPETGHPRIYLNLGPDGQIVCPYCSKTFVKENK
ncbi:MAG: zinc-finger domain-containing protein [Alphaproteobacteria bacterium]